MIRLLRSTASVLLLSLAFAALGDAPRPRLAVLPFTGSRLDEESLGVLADRVRSAAPELARSNGYIVMTQESMAMLIKEMGVSCTGQEECEVERARSIGASLVVSGDVRAFGKTLVLGMRLHDARTGELLAAQDVQVATSKALLDGIGAAARKLLRQGLSRVAGVRRAVGEGPAASTTGQSRNPEDSPPEVAVAFESRPPGAQVIVDGEMTCPTTPCTQRVAEGRHQVSMKLERYETGTAQVAVKRGTRVALTLQPGFASLNVQTDPPGLALTLDGSPAGVSPVEANQQSPSNDTQPPCTTGATCLALGVELQSGTNGRVVNPAAAAPFYQRACELGEGAGCTRLGNLVENGSGPAKDEARAAELYARACDLRDAEGCNLQGLSRFHGKGIAKDLMVASEVLTKGCGLGSGAACRNLGWNYQNGFGVEKDATRAAESYGRACELKDYWGCSNLGSLRERGVGVVRSPELAAELYEKACEQGIHWGCNNLGRLREGGTGVVRSPELAAELYKKACDMGNLWGCNNLGVLRERGTGVVRSPELAAELYKKACDMGNPWGCRNLGLCYQKGRGVPKDLVLAVELFEKACTQGNLDSCARKTRTSVNE